MANGTMKDAASYYGDSTKYWDISGRSTNPYVIEDVYDFCNIKSISNGSSNGSHFILAKDIDFNDHPVYKYGITAAFTATNWNYNSYDCGKLNLNGHTIRNMIFSNVTDTLIWINMTNGNIANLIMLNCDDTKPIKGNMNGVNVGVFMSNSKLRSLFYNEKYSNCTFTIRGLLDECFTDLGGAVFSRVHFDLDIACNVTYTWLFGESGSTATTYDNSYVTGTIKVNSIGLVTISSNARRCYLFDTRITISNFYFAATIIPPNMTASYITCDLSICSTGSSYDAKVTAISFIDKDLLNKFNAVGNSISNLKLLTTEQCKDVNYLMSIGFPVVPKATESESDAPAGE